MELDELKQTWNEQTQKLDRVLSLNVQSFKAAQLEKTKSALDRFKLYLIFELLVGLALLLGTGSYLASHLSALTLAGPALIFGLSVLVAVCGDIRELILLGQISYAEPVTVSQKKLEDIKLHLLRTLRLMVLMLPLYMVYVILGLNLFFGWDILEQGNAAFRWGNLVVSLVLVAPAVWLFRNLSFNGMSHPVIRVLIEGAGGKQVIAALAFLKTLQEFEDEERVSA
ncbi:MAG: hypothetical protein ACR2ID_03250 [Chthoniobacterales bacterium]